jgi:hypothetical protein
MAPADLESMDVPLESTSPSSRRNKGKLAEAIQSMTRFGDVMDLDLPTDPDAQATVTDFLDFTEYLPSDMVRSLTLIGNLDSTWSKASLEVDDLTRVYGQLPSMPAEAKPEPTRLRADISQNMSEAVSARTASYAEACRMAENVERHYSRIKNIHAKLQLIAETYPTTRESSPIAKPKSPVLNRPPKITLRVGGHSDGHRVRKHRAPRITVPGEVLAPYELDYESYGSESEGSSEGHFDTARETPARSVTAGGGSRIKLKVAKRDKTRDRPRDKTREKVSKPPRESRPAGFGTNVHSQKAGISTSNALRLLQSPPPDAKPGSEHLPWLALSDYELGVLRKKMKKNAVWSPSDTMINRELKARGRGMEAYKAAVGAASEKGETIEPPPQLTGQIVNEIGALSTEAATKGLEEDAPVMNRGMKLNEAKKLKRDNQKKEIEAADGSLAEAQRKVGNVKLAMQTIFTSVQKARPGEDKKAPVKTPSKTPSRSHKRKREPDPVEPEVIDGEKPVTTDGAAKPQRPLLKRTKTETPVPVPQPIAAKQSTPALSEAPSVVSENPSAPSVITAVPAPVSVLASAPAPIEVHPPETPATPLPPSLTSPKKSSTPILPPVKDNKKLIKKEVKKTEVPTATSERPRRGSAQHTPITPAPSTTSTAVAAPAVVPIATTDILPAKRPTSSRSKAASMDRDIPIASASIDRPRRASTARNTPAPEPRLPNRRQKRPAPGVVTKGPEESTAVSVGKRSAATRKKAGPKKEKKDGRESSAAQETFDEVDDEGNVIDPNEPRYCLCNRVSFGIMIGCENADVNNSSILSPQVFSTTATISKPSKTSEPKTGNSSTSKDILPSTRENANLSSKSEPNANMDVSHKCEKEWFHLECVGLTDIPPRTTKWYCPECRITLGIGEKGEVNARGKKK